MPAVNSGDHNVGYTAGYLAATNELAEISADTAAVVSGAVVVVESSYGVVADATALGFSSSHHHQHFVETCDFLETAG